LKAIKRKKKKKRPKKTRTGRMTRFSNNRHGFQFASNGLECRGAAVIPEEGNRTAIILIHGWGTCRIGPQRFYVHFAEQLASEGYPVFRFDLPGRGESEGDDLKISIDDMVQSVKDCISYIKEHYSSVERIGLCGICSGGNTAILASLREKTDFLILWSTFSFRPDKPAAVKVRRTGHLLKVYFRKLFSASTWKKLFSGMVNFKLIFKTVFGHHGAQPDTLKDSKVNVMAEWKEYKSPVLFVYGKKDPEAAEAEKEYREYCEANGMNASFEGIRDASHNFYKQEWREELFNKSLEFVKSAT
jgi:dienelactone hydrolase